jgi:hypothetical protein
MTIEYTKKLMEHIEQMALELEQKDYEINQLKAVNEALSIQILFEQNKTLSVIWNSL